VLQSPQVTLLRSRRLVGLSGSAVSLSLARERHVFGVERVTADLSQPLGFRTAPAGSPRPFRGFGARRERLAARPA